MQSMFMTSVFEVLVLVTNYGANTLLYIEGLLCGWNNWYLIIHESMTWWCHSVPLWGGGGVRLHFCRELDDDYNSCILF